jgi:hypothetical protein
LDISGSSANNNNLILSNLTQDFKETEAFVQQVRETFFSLLRPYFTRIDDFINKRVASNGAFFDKYFLISEYLA